MITDPIAFFEHWKGLPHQRAAVLQFWEGVPASLKKDDAGWYETWKADGKQETTRAITNPLRVPYFSQRDSATAHALRMCFSSSCAMLLEAIRPGTLQGPNGDDAYLGRVLRYGDTIDSTSQLKALASFGVQASLTHAADWQTIHKQIDAGFPVPIGILHKGPVERPTGGGHWICAIGYSDDAIIVHDPFGNLNLITGLYLNNWGAKLQYSKRNLGRRWMVDAARGNAFAPGMGWAIIAKPS